MRSSIQLLAYGLQFEIVIGAGFSSKPPSQAWAAKGLWYRDIHSSWYAVVIYVGYVSNSSKALASDAYIARDDRPTSSLKCPFM